MWHTTTLLTYLAVVALVMTVAETADPKLKFVLVFHRHGARAPIKSKTDLSDWNNKEQLTAVGMRQLFLLGTELRKRYITDRSFLPSSYDTDSIYVRSTQVNRTIMSAASLLAGLYPNGTGPQLPENYPIERANPPFPIEFDPTPLGRDALPKRFQVVPIHSSQKDKDYFFLANEPDTCPALVPNRKARVIADGKVIMDAFDGMINEISTTFKIPKADLDMYSLTQICDTMLMSFMDNRPLPIDAGGKLFKDMLAFLNVTAIFKVYPTREMSRTTATRMIDEFLDKFDGAASGKSPLKFAEFSAHDSTLDNFLDILNVTSTKCQLERYKAGKMDEFDHACPYSARVSSNMVFEMWQDDAGTNYLRLFYDDKLYQLLGEDLVEYPKFRAALKAEQVPDFMKACRGAEPAPPPTSVPIWQWVVLGVQAAVILLLVALMITNCMKLKKNSKVDDMLLEP